MTEVVLHAHQEKAVEDMHNGCVLTGGVGSGKTITALAYAELKEKGKHIYVITTAKKRDSGDWEMEAAKMAFPFDQVTVDSWNNIKNYADVEDAFFIFDEQRVVGMGAWTQSFFTICKANHWVLLSATPGDTWLDYVPVFIANGFYKNVTEFRQKHVIYSRFSKYPKVDRYVDEAILRRRRNLILVPMPDQRHTVRHMEYIDCDFDKELFDRVWKRRWNVFEEEPIRDAGELFRVARKVVATHPARMDAVRELLKKHPKLIIFYNYDYELEELRKLAWEPQIAGNVAEWNGHKHEKIPASDSWVYLVQYTAGAEGWNCTTTDAMCFYSLTYSYKQFEQAQGRIDRMNTPFTDLHYYLLTSKSPAEVAVLRSVRAKKDFQPSTIVPKKSFEMAQKAA